jgi:sigma-B regulation protein RsbU (phosphoserine phosphatase)
MSLDDILKSNRIPKKNDITQKELEKFIMKYRGLLKEQQRDRSFWAATNENLKNAYQNLDEKEKELERAYSIIQEDLSVASQIQEALLPKVTDRMEEDLELAVYHKQLAEVGGDYYDFFRTKNGNYAVGLFDISGHGVSAALVMTYLKAQFMTVMERSDSPRVIVDWVNNLSYSFLKTVKKYATVNFVVFGKKKLSYVNGGGFGVLLHEGESSTFFRKDPFLGLRCKPFHEHTLPFIKGDLLVLYTDGMIEAQNDRSEDYTVKRLNRLVKNHHEEPVKDILGSVIEDYSSFRSKDTDDITLIVMRKKV